MDLRCYICNNPLSIAPIRTREDISICGRCTPENTNFWTRNYIYEKLAKHFKFPCSFCNKERSLAWNEVEEHERQCSQKGILCPGKMKYHEECQKAEIKCPMNCGSFFEVRTVFGHFKRFHKEYVFETSVVKARKILKEEKIWNYTPNSNVCLVFVKSIPFFLFIHNACEYNESTGDIINYDFYFSVFSLCRYESTFNYDVKVNIGNNILKELNQKIKPFKQHLHRVAFLTSNLIALESFNFMTTQFKKIPKTQDLKLIYEIKIHDYTIKKPIAFNFASKENLAVTVKSFECPICKEYLSRPVFNCATGHSFCGNCNKKLTNCPYCQAVVGGSRNYILEDVLETMRVICPNERKGCEFMGTVSEVKKHEINCVFN